MAKVVVWPGDGLVRIITTASIKMAGSTEGGHNTEG
jgi:hypothetical protein